MIIDGYIQCFPAGELRTFATFSIATHRDLLKAGHAFERCSMFIAHRRRSRMQITPTTETGAPQDTA